MRLIAVLGLYLTLVTWLTWPLWPSSATHLPCTAEACAFDTLHSVWALAYESHALANAPLSIADGNIFFPERQAIFYGPPGFGGLPYFAPVYALSGNAGVATAALLILCAALTAAALHFVAYRWTGSHAAGAVAATTFLTNRWALWGLIASAPHLMALQYFPFVALLASRKLDSRGRWAALLALVVLQCLDDPVYIASAVLVPLAVLGLVRVSRRETRREGLRLAALLAVTVLLLTPVYAGFAMVRARNPDLAKQTLWVRHARPTELTGLFWWGSAPTTIVPAALAVIIVGGGLALVRRRRSEVSTSDRLPTAHAWLHALLWTVVGTLISLTPVVAWHGRNVPGPLMLVGWLLPAYDVIRAPERLGVAGLMGLCLLAGLGYAELARRVPRALNGGLAVAVLVLVYLVPPGDTERLPSEYPLQTIPASPPAFETVLRSGHEPLLHWPAISDGGDYPLPHANARAMYLSIGHWRPLLNGYASYWPEGFIERMSVAARLPDAAAVQELVQQTNVGLVWVDLEALGDAQRARWVDVRALEDSAGLTLVAREGPHLLFALRPR